MYSTIDKIIGTIMVYIMVMVAVCLTYLTWMIITGQVR